jgi:nitroimidazol reductase NimA-like FMN-containing flavoprotein (pyridoxamine 5'-phosphate oxidase superfamily)
VKRLPPQVDAVLDHGSMAYLAVGTRAGPHVTPVVYSMFGSRMWVTTARRTVKGGIWRIRPRVAGLVRSGERSVSFVGSVRLHDLLNPGTWPASLLELPTITVAAAGFTTRNARFFAGYAVDARRVPLSWTPPGRVFAELSIRACALLEDWGEEPVTWGAMGEQVRSHGSFRPGRSAHPPLTLVPEEVASVLERGGQAVLAVDGADGPVVLPVLYVEERGVLYAAVEARSRSAACCMRRSRPGRSRWRRRGRTRPSGSRWTTRRGGVRRT